MKKTIKQKKNKYRALQYTFTAGEYVSVATPYAVMAAINKDEWFVYNPEPWKIGLGGTLGLALMALSVFLVTKKKENNKLTDGMIGLVVGWYAVAFVFFLLAKINMEIYTIMFYGGFGLLGALGLNVGSKNFENKANKMKNAIVDAQAEKDKEQARYELDIEEEKKENKSKKKVRF